MAAEASSLGAANTSGYGPSNLDGSSSGFQISGTNDASAPIGYSYSTLMGTTGSVDTGYNTSYNTGYTDGHYRRPSGLRLSEASVREPSDYRTRERRSSDMLILESHPTASMAVITVMVTMVTIIIIIITTTTSTAMAIGKPKRRNINNSSRTGTGIITGTSTGTGTSTSSNRNKRAMAREAVALSPRRMNTRRQDASVGRRGRKWPRPHKRLMLNSPPAVSVEAPTRSGRRPGGTGGSGGR
ncbi:hypothetical protein XA68_11127 [Ophiocordyceps unilateralis]|uniref:Uncharacterized protein n=1 Tax=Ophiocordyceps unilateralis TaxID=268505 RepID=A0A2A9PHL4_OPHUN|nr:hypothetical protein XA68_11127 [Ophiocordyceps unilateralis]